MKRVAKFLRPVLVLLVLSSGTSAQDFWVEKSYKHWTKQEIIKIISDSPWAQVCEVEADTTKSGGPVPSVTVRLRSAVSIRRALVRIRQLEENYDKMNDQERAKFDEKLRGILECPACQENYVITISPPISNRSLRSGVYGLKSASLRLLQGKVYLLNDTSDRRELVSFVAPKSDADEAVFFFPRFDSEGNAFLTNKNQKFTFVFDAENIPIIGGETTTTRRVVTDGSTPVDDKDTIGTITKGRTVPRQVIFDVTKLIRGGAVEF